MNWYYSENDAQLGPVTQEQFDALVKSGKIGRETMVWRDGMQDWAPYGDLAYAPGLPAMATSTTAPPMAPTPPIPAAAVIPAGVALGPSSRCAECGNYFPESEMIAFENARVCAACKPIFVQKLKEGITPAGVLNYAGFWIRFAAQFIDGIILQASGFCIGLVTGMALRGGDSASSAPLVAGLIGFLTGISYMVFFNGRFGATPGKMALKLKIVRPDGEPITYMRALGRYFGQMVSSLTLCIGFMMAGWDEEKRALHDRICDTRVIRR